jgi:hypothetical protein
MFCAVPVEEVIKLRLNSLLRNEPYNPNDSTILNGFKLQESTLKFGRCNLKAFDLD